MPTTPPEPAGFPHPDACIRAHKLERASASVAAVSEVGGDPARAPPLMTVADVARRRGCSVATVWRHVKAGILPPPIKLGGLTRWVPEEVEAAIARAMAARDRGEQ
jgi:predicted DNA-binding transcriptional regulator AlpA